MGFHGLKSASGNLGQIIKRNARSNLQPELLWTGSTVKWFGKKQKVCMILINPFCPYSWPGLFHVRSHLEHTRLHARSHRQKSSRLEHATCSPYIFCSRLVCFTSKT